MRNRKLGVIVSIYLVSTLAGCGGKFVKTKSEDLAPFADQTISMVADIAEAPGKILAAGAKTVF